MDPVTLVVVPGVLGGLALAFLFIRFQHRRGDARPDPLLYEPRHAVAIRSAP